MKDEIERKFLVTNNDYQKLARGATIQQGYLSTDVSRSVRIRVDDDKAWLTIKGKSKGAVRKEFEFQVPTEEAKEMIQTLCIKPIITKTRYKIKIGAVLWEVDEFFEENEGLVIAEVEIPYEDYKLELPDWVGKEVTTDARYYNVNLIENPYTKW